MFLYFVSALFLFCDIIYCSSLNETTKWPSKISLSQAEFAVRLLHAAARSGKSAVLSPFSVAIALAMINAGASGTTRKQLNDVLAKGTSVDALKDYFKKHLKNVLTPLGGFQMNMASKLFVQKNLEMLKDYKQMIDEDYASKINEIDFQKPEIVSSEINKWAKSQIDDTSGELVEDEMFIDATKMVLVSMASFDAVWQKPFNEFATRNQTFYQSLTKRKKVSVMAQSNYFDYYSDRTVSAIALPYKDGKVFMYIFLPKDKYGLIAFEKTLTVKKMYRIIRSMKKAYVDLVLPRFRMERKFDLASALNRMGVIDAFIGEANFTGMCEELLFMSNLIHKAVTEVNERGTKAATNGASKFEWNFIPVTTSLPIQFIADHPFLFAIL
uniref:Serpin domain-containing protein n=1 Tax=Parascaris univalens TaxID=6257 RepID=A0A915BRV7_PARUN